MCTCKPHPSPYCLVYPCTIISLELPPDKTHIKSTFESLQRGTAPCRGARCCWAHVPSSTCHVAPSTHCCRCQSCQLSASSTLQACIPRLQAQLAIPPSKAAQAAGTAVLPCHVYHWLHPEPLSLLQLCPACSVSQVLRPPQHLITLPAERATCTGKEHKSTPCFSIIFAH
jgi:hypothetical protein